MAVKLLASHNDVSGFRSCSCLQLSGSRGWGPSLTRETSTDFLQFGPVPAIEIWPSPSHRVHQHTEVLLSLPPHTPFYNNIKNNNLKCCLLGNTTYSYYIICSILKIHFILPRGQFESFFHFPLLRPFLTDDSFKKAPIKTNHRALGVKTALGEKTDPHCNFS